jgi:hypothetical protein
MEDVQMELRLKELTAWNVFIWSLNAVTVVLLLWTCSVFGSAG